MTVPTLPGIEARTITTPRLTTRVLFCGPEEGIPILFVHGNLSSATWWEEVMLSLPEGYRAIAPDQRGFGDADPTKIMDASRGMGDLADDLIALLDYLGIERTCVVGHSLGGNVVWRLMTEIPERLINVMQVCPGSPYGFGGTRDADGTPCFDDYAGSGGGLINANLIKSIEAGDASADSPFTVRSALRLTVYKPPFIPEREEAIVQSALAIHTGDKGYPGDTTASTNWPFIAPGKWGASNGLSPKNLQNPRRLINLNPKPPVLWIRGSDDKVVSDTSISDPATLGQMGLIPNYPGVDVCPSQPMIKQTRTILDGYAQAGGTYQEIVMQNVAHAPYVENLTEFNTHFHAFLAQHTPSN